MSWMGTRGMALVLAAGLIGSAQGSVTYTGATRTVQAGASNATPVTATDFGPYSHSTTGSVGFTSCSASMNSTLEPTQVPYSGRVSASGDHSGGIDFYGYANATQNLQVTFSQTTAVWIEGQTTFVQGISSNIGWQATIRQGSETAQNLPTSVATALQLSAGSYTIHTNVSSAAGPAFGLTATADYAFIVHMDAVCAVDYDHSGSVNTIDILTFLDRWFEANPSADFNGVNGVEVQDIFDFLNAWFVGC